jgi:hypothetical protein
MIEISQPSILYRYFLCCAPLRRKMPEVNLYETVHANELQSPPYFVTYDYLWLESLLGSSYLIYVSRDR